MNYRTLKLIGLIGIVFMQFVLAWQIHQRHVLLQRIVEHAK